jgi:hypothetical protein
MTTKDYLQDISEIKNIMNKSTRFMSLSGLSGVLAGTYALVGAYIVHNLLKGYASGEGKLSELSASNVEMLMIGLGLFIAFIAALTGYILTKRKAEKNNEKMWTPASKQMLMSFIVPMVTGGLFIMMLIQKGYYGLVAPSTLIFYGLALYNAGKYTLSQVRYLGLLEILLGLLALYFIYNGLLFWTIGFGVLHILYGAIMYFKLERE